MLAADTTVSDPAPLYYSKILAVKPGFVVDNPAALHDVRASFPAAGRVGQSGVSARVTIDLTPSLRLTSLSAYRRSDLEALIDGDISALDLNCTDVDDAQHQWSEELTVVHRWPRLTWIAGLFLFDEVDRQRFTLGAPSVRRENHLDGLVGADAGAAFAQTTIQVWPRVAITAGLRYTHERKTIDNSGRMSILDPPMTILPGAYQYTDAIVHDAWTPKIGADVRLRDRVLAYASATRGFKSGGFNLSSPEAGRGFAPEWAWSYEAGLKTEIPRARARVNVAAFYTAYTDLQVQTGIRPGVIDISNAAAHGHANVKSTPTQGTDVQVWLPIDVPGTRLDALHQNQTDDPFRGSGAGANGRHADVGCRPCVIDPPTQIRNGFRTSAESSSHWCCHRSRRWCRAASRLVGCPVRGRSESVTRRRTPSSHRLERRCRRRR
jgi:hypothetical protein